MGCMGPSSSTSFFYGLGRFDRGKSQFQGSCCLCGRTACFGEQPPGAATAAVIVVRRCVWFLDWQLLLLLWEHLCCKFGFFLAFVAALFGSHSAEQPFKSRVCFASCFSFSILHKINLSFQKRLLKQNNKWNEFFLFGLHFFRLW